MGKPMIDAEPPASVLKLFPIQQDSRGLIRHSFLIKAEFQPGS
jgi:hypothetical protein